MNDSPRIQTILFATDFLESSRLALDYAVAFAHKFGATIRMLHVLELSTAAVEAELFTARPSLSRQSALRRLEALAAGVRRTGLGVETVLREGIPADEILRAACDGSCDLLVLGVHGVHRGVNHLLIGSNTEKILLSATCPTLTVGAHALAGVDLEAHFDAILYFADLTPESAAAAPWAAFLARSFRIPVDVGQLLPAPPEISQEEAQRLADAFCDRLRETMGTSDSPWQQPAFQLERGVELEQLLQRSQTAHAGLIVLGVRTPSPLDRRLHASFAYRLIAHATCPVLTILRNPSAEHPAARPH